MEGPDISGGTSPGSWEKPEWARLSDGTPAWPHARFLNIKIRGRLSKGVSGQHRSPYKLSHGQAFQGSRGTGGCKEKTPFLAPSPSEPSDASDSHSLPACLDGQPGKELFHICQPTAGFLRAKTGLLPLREPGTRPGTQLVPAEYFMMKKRGSNFTMLPQGQRRPDIHTH